MKYKKPVFVFLVILLLSGIAITIISHIHPSPIKTNHLQNIRNGVRIISVLIILIFGTLLRSKKIIFISVLVFLMLLGAVFQIMRWPFADILIITSVITALLFYINHYVNKPVKTALDIAKLFYATFICLRLAASSLQSVNTDCAKCMEDILFHILFIIFTIQFYKQYLTTTAS